MGKDKGRIENPIDGNELHAQLVDRLMGLIEAKLKEKPEELPGDIRVVSEIILELRERIKAGQPAGNLDEQPPHIRGPIKVRDTSPSSLDNNLPNSEKITQLRFDIMAIVSRIYIEEPTDSNPENRKRWNRRLKFGPFVELSKLHPEYTPEQLMDNKTLRQACALALTNQAPVHSSSSAASIYAHVTEPFRSKPGSGWEQYKHLEKLSS